MAANMQKLGKRWGWRRWLIAACGAGAIAGGVCCWQFMPWKPASAQAAAPAPQTASNSQTSAPVAGPATNSDYSKRVVAYIHDNVPVTREQLGEYLIARYGAERLELMVNKMIIDEASQARGVVVTEAEINAKLTEDMKGLGLNQTQFVNDYLKAHHMNLFEWKEDVIRPKLQLSQMARDRVTYKEEEVREVWESLYGEKVEVCIILYPREESRQAEAEYGRLRDDPEAFRFKATHQASSQLAAKGGAIDKPIGRRTSGCSEKFENDLFSLHEGEITQLHEEPQGIVVAKCIKRIPAATDKTIEQVRGELVKEIIERKTLLEVPKIFKELHAAAHPNLLLAGAKKPDDAIKQVPKLLQETEKFSH